MFLICFLFRQIHAPSLVVTATVTNNTNSSIANSTPIKVGYSNNISNNSNKEEIGLSLVIRKILEIDDNNGRFRLNLMLGLEWTDTRLRYLNLKGTVLRELRRVF